MSKFNRRQFVKGSAVGSAALAVSFNPWARVLGANERINSAVAGIGGRGGSHMNALEKSRMGNVVGLCDVDATILDRVASGFEKKYKRKVDKAVDVRRLLDRKDIDVLTIATPNHWHALMTIWAVQAGKDVYVEKPVSHNVWEGRQIVNAARKHKKIVQTGTQSRSSQSSIGEAVKWTQSGKLGKILYAVGTCFKPRRSIGKLDKPLEIPDHIDYDKWCGPALKVPLFRPRLKYDWHWDFNTGCGDIGNQGIHQMDVARWFLGESKLSPRVISIGGRLGYDDAGDTPNTQTVLHDYPNAPLIFETRGLPNKDLNWKTGMPRYRGSGVGVLVQCENGHVLIPNYYSAKAYDKDGKEVKNWRSGDPMTAHVTNFLKACQSRKHSELNADIEEGHISSALCHTGNVSHRLGSKAPAGKIREAIKGDKLFAESFERFREHLGANGIDITKGVATLGPVLEMNPDTETFTNNAKANELLTRPYRKGYVVPDLSGSL